LGWQIELTDTAKKQLAKLGKAEARRITAFLRQRFASLNDPRSTGKSLKGACFGGLWRYRVGDYRLICQIQDKCLVILVIEIGHRREIYR